MPTTNQLQPWREYQRANRMAKRVMLRLPDDLYEQIAKEAVSQKKDFTEMVRIMCKDWIESGEPNEAR